MVRLSRVPIMHAPGVSPIAVMLWCETAIFRSGRVCALFVIAVPRQNGNRHRPKTRAPDLELYGTMRRDFGAHSQGKAEGNAHGKGRQVLSSDPSIS
jgi:hypothetical protein